METEEFSTHLEKKLDDVSKLRPEEIPLAIEILNNSFDLMHLKLSGVIPTGKKEGERVKTRFFRDETQVIAIRSASGTLKGVCLVQYQGTRAVIGPLAVDSSMMGKFSSFDLIREFVLKNDPHSKVEVFETVTFSHSPLHASLHWKSFEPLLPCFFLTKSLRKHISIDSENEGGSRVLKFSEMDQIDKEKHLDKCKTLLGKFSRGLDYSAEMLQVEKLRLGETYFFEDTSESLLGLAICHFGPQGESFSDEQFLIKHLYLDPKRPKSVLFFKKFISELEFAARSKGLLQVGLMISAGRRLATQTLLESHYKISQVHTQWVRSHKDQDELNKKDKYRVSHMKRFLEVDPFDFLISEMR